MLKCSLCEKVFTKTCHIKRHVKNVHKLEYVKETEKHDFNAHNFKCLESECSISFKHNKDLIHHLMSNHDISIETEVVLFENLKAFEDWKTELESRENSAFLQRNARRNGDGSQKIYYNCSRSISKRKVPSQNIQRSAKMQGSCKLEYACTSGMVVSINSTGIKVEHIVSHYGHKPELQFLRLSKQDVEQVAGKLVLGVPTEKILESNRENISVDLKRSDLMTTQDVKNIKKRYNLQVSDGERHPLDTVSIELWVQEAMKSEGNPVLFYKAQGEAVDFYKDDDFCLMMMNSYQRHMLETYGSNIICVDSTHGLNGYDFELTTVLVVDNYGEGFPVAYMFTNRKDTEVNRMFFSKLKEKVGSIKCQTFMSDITTVFYSAWEGVMGSAVHQLFCSWHVDRAWKSQLGKIKCDEKKKWVYKTLKVLQKDLTHRSEEDFLADLHATISLLLDDPETEAYGIYFNSQYATNYKKWAYLYRKSCGINNNMFLESMHKVVKYFYLNGRKVRRLDKGLHAVLRYTRNKTIDRVIKNTKGKRTKVVADIHVRHRRAQNSVFKVVKESDVEWAIISEGLTYKVKKVNNNCCLRKCTTCNVCIHAFECTCVDFYIRSTICKHIHWICLEEQMPMSETSAPHGDNADNSVLNDTYICLKHIEENNASENNASSKKEKILAANAALQSTLRSCVSFDNIDSDHIVSLLRSANELLKLGQIPHKFKQGQESNDGRRQKLVPQKRKFSSTKKVFKRKVQVQGPRIEVADIKSHLKGNNLLISTSFDHDYTNISQT